MFEVEIRRMANEADVLVSVRCDVDLAVKEQFREALALAQNMQADRIVVSLLECRYIDSTCINALLDASRATSGALLAIVPPGTIVARIFKIADLARVLPIFESFEEALISRAS